MARTNWLDMPSEDRRMLGLGQERAHSPKVAAASGSLCPEVQMQEEMGLERGRLRDGAGEGQADGE